LLECKVLQTLLDVGDLRESQEQLLSVTQQLDITFVTLDEIQFFRSWGALQQRACGGKHGD
jgi:hypothetical protein